MSRFGLRSNSDPLKLSEEKANSKRPCKTAKVSLKRIHLKKKKLPLLKDDAEPKEPPAGSSNGQPADGPISLVCSLPLERITGIIEKLKLTSLKSEATNLHDESVDIEPIVKGESEAEAERDNEIDDGDSTLASALTSKILCLYCDKKFSSPSLQLKHVEKFHTQQQDRRSSGRTSQLQFETKNPQATTSSSSSSTSLATPPSRQHFPGCTFCRKTKTNHIAAPAKDLNRLFVHLTECHADKYFGCKICTVRLQSIGKLSKHMQVVHKNPPFVYDECSKSKDDESDTLSDKTTAVERFRLSRTRLQKSALKSSASSTTTTVSQDNAQSNSSTIIGAEEPILSRLGLTQNRLPSNRKGMRLRRESSMQDVLLKTSEQAAPNTLITSPAKVRSKVAKGVAVTQDAEVVFRVPTRTDVLSCVFDDDFYKEVVANVRNNMLYHLDGKILDNASSVKPMAAELMRQPLPHINSTLVKSSIVLSGALTTDSELHAATSLAATTAFPTLLTAEQYGGDATSSKIRRPHTKHSWKWKWDSVKKYKLINEGGKIIKKMKQPMLGLRDLSKLDMWTQLSMRQKHEMFQQKARPHRAIRQSAETVDATREEKQRLSEQLNFILDMRLLPNIILEQNEQAVIKFEHDEENGATEYGENSALAEQPASDASFLSVLNLLPTSQYRQPGTRLVLSGEWARPRCYMCMCCGAKFDKLKSLEEHKMFRHAHILSTHYEVVGRELLAGNFLRHLFIPKKALSQYENKMGAANTDVALLRGNINLATAAEDESSDSAQSLPNSCTTLTSSLKHSTTDECDTDTKTTLDINTVSPAHSMQSSNSSFSVPLMKMQLQRKNPQPAVGVPSCTKCQRKCGGTLDLYRHMLDCSGDYIWALAKKRKYRYYCGSKKRRPYNKHNFTELRKQKPKIMKPPTVAHDTEESGSSFSKTKTPPRARPSDAESIKKMLENLPPKRVVKNIFPTPTKPKKSKLIAKHKIYNTKVLRKTRARQIAEAKKRTKSKSQFPARRKAASNKRGRQVFNKRKNNQLKKLQLQKKADQRQANTPAKSPEPQQEELKPTEAAQSEAKEESPKTKVEDVKVECNESKQNNETKLATPTKKIPSSAPPGKPSQTSAVELAVTSQPNPITAANALPFKPATALTTQQPEGLNSCKKRRKGISDCIAMLTGKLEEKLKTESIVTNKEEAEKPVGVPKETVCHTAIATVATASLPTDTGTSIKDEAKLAPTPPEKKTPKRKTISRRIIKPPEIFNAEVPVTPPKSVAAASVTAPPALEVASIIAAPPAALATCMPLTIAPKMQSKSTAVAAAVDAPKLKPVPMTVPVPVPVPVPTAALPSLPTAPVTVAPVPMPMPASLHPIPKEPAPLATPAASNNAPPIPISIVPLPPGPIPIAALNMLPKLPLYIPVQNLPSIPIAISMESGQPNVPPAVALVNATPLLHPPPQASHQLFCNEPLNLSSAKSAQKQHNSHDFSISHRPGMPSRRMTICGLEARNFMHYNEMEPLDLSKKSSSKEAAQPKVVDMTPQAVSLVKSTEAAPPTLPTSDLVLNKHFYSNLDLLKIPQVRNPIYVSPPAPEMATNLSVVKPAAKKRNTVKDVPVSPKPPLIVVNNLVKTPVKEAPLLKKETPLPRKETVPKSKPLLKMDEEVINHIDDAIDAVINAVNASLPETDDVTKEVVPIPEVSVQTFQPIAAEVLSPQKSLGPAPLKRSMRSKTMDCRPLALSANVNLSSSQQDSGFTCSTPKSFDQEVPQSIIIDTPKPAIEAAPPIKQKKNLSTPKEVVTKETKLAQPAQLNQSTPDIDISPIKALTEIQAEPTTAAAVIIPLPMPNKDPSLPSAVASSDTDVNTAITEEHMSNINNTSSGFHSSVQSETVVADPVKKQRRRRKNELAAIVADQLLESFKLDKTRRDNLKKLENMAYEKSEDLFVTGMLLMSSTKRSAATAAAQSTSQTKGKDKEKTDEAPKRQKAEPKESKAKSKAKTSETAQKPAEPDTSTEAQQEPVKQPEAPKTAAAKPSPKPAAPKPAGTKGAPKKRQELAPALIDITPPLPAVPVASEKKEPPAPKKPKKRAYRRRGKALDNENISKLKSSLESFSIGIEKQLSEIEAKQHNNFNSIEPKKRSGEPAKTTKPTLILRPSILAATLEQPKPQAKENQVQSPNSQFKNQINVEKMEAKESNFAVVKESKLPPSEPKAEIIPAAESKQQLPATKNQARETKQQLLEPKNPPSDDKPTVFSRDPRLNKNIHKDDNDVNQNQSKTAKNRTRANVDGDLDEIGDLEEDNYLTEIAKNVNEKIMSGENEDFMFDNDGFELGNDYQDDSNSKFSRPPTSMSVRSAPNFDERSNFGSICDENTNTEVMDMDLDDEMSVYTSFSQDVGRGRGRRRRRRRSILLKRRPKKRPSVRDLTAETFECTLCKKTFFTANSLTKHNMTLAHVSKVSELEYLQSKSQCNILDNVREMPKTMNSNAKRAKPRVEPLPSNVITAIETPRAICAGGRQAVSTEVPLKSVDKRDAALNPDERLFFECCNILKNAETPRRNSEDNDASYVRFATSQDQNTPNSTYQKAQSRNGAGDMNSLIAKQPVNPERISHKSLPAPVLKPSVFKDPQIAPVFNNVPMLNTANEQNRHSPVYSGISQFSAVTSTATSRFKTKAAMKGYESVNIGLTMQQELDSKSKTVCKLTELADIALGSNKQPNSPESTPTSDDRNEDDSDSKRLETPEYPTMSAVGNQQKHTKMLPPKSVDNHSTTSSKTIMHSSIIKAVMEEHNKAPTNKIVIPERPFKNIGLEEKETITFQKPKTPAVNLLTDDNSVSTASYSDRDDFDFNSMSSGEDSNLKTDNDKTLKNNSSDSSSSRATAKTFENKSLIMGRIFKNANTRSQKPLKLKSIPAPKEQPAPQPQKTDLNQLFDELRGGCGGKTREGEPVLRAADDVTRKTMGAPSTAVEAPIVVRPSRKKPKKEKKATVSKMQTELGMSNAEFEKLIDEGQRKSKRRCATNRQKKLVEMWSSDEYEEFLSTKDVIALIEEQEKKEQQEKKRKRRNSIYQPPGGEPKEKDLDSTQISELKMKNSTFSVATSEGNERLINEKSVGAGPSTAQVQNETVNTGNLLMPVEELALLCNSTSKTTDKSQTGKQPTQNKRSKNATQKSKGKAKAVVDEVSVANDGSANIKPKRKKNTSSKSKRIAVECDPSNVTKLQLNEVSAPKPKKKKSSIAKSDRESSMALEAATTTTTFNAVGAKPKKKKSANSKYDGVPGECTNTSVDNSVKPKKKKTTTFAEEAAKMAAASDKESVASLKVKKQTDIVSKYESIVAETSASGTLLTESKPKKKRSGTSRPKNNAVKAAETLMFNSILQSEQAKINTFSQSEIFTGLAQRTHDSMGAATEEGTTVKPQRNLIFEGVASKLPEMVATSRHSDKDSEPSVQIIPKFDLPIELDNSEPLEEEDEDLNLAALRLASNQRIGRAGRKKKKEENLHTDVEFDRLKALAPHTDTQLPEGTKKRAHAKNYKSKRKNQSNQSLPRRKRLASEKLYYQDWSSSSDEEFGRIDNAQAEEFDSGEQYQKHGWIVGDSHKKLVTLLAIAKGNKKVENCGVKKNISKKKS